MTGYGTIALITLYTALLLPLLYIWREETLLLLAVQSCCACDMQQVNS
jgi:hypothetical protein